MTTDRTTNLPADPARHDGWTYARQHAFLEALKDSGNVERAAAVVGKSASSAYRMRGRPGSDVFDHGWRAAQAMAYHRLRDIAFDRIDNGVATPSTYRGEVVTTKTVFSDRLLIALLEHLKPAPETLGPNGLRRSAADPERDFAATMDAYAAAIARGRCPKMPPSRDGGGGGGDEPPRMTRAEFVAAIGMRHRPPVHVYNNAADWEGGDGNDPRPGETNSAGVNFA